MEVQCTLLLSCCCVSRNQFNRRLSLSSIHGKFTAQLTGYFLYVATAPIHRPNNLIQYSLCRNKILYCPCITVEKSMPIWQTNIIIVTA